MAHEAVVVGATGLVGREIVALLLDDARYTRVRVLVRRATGVTHDKLDEHLVDFDAPASWTALVTGDVVFSALGTTLKAAGSKDAQYRVDHTYQLVTAQAARSIEGQRRTDVPSMRLEVMVEAVRIALAAALAGHGTA